jgi:hypothetical protein
MGHLMFYLAVVATCLLWSATFTALAARVVGRGWRRLLVAIAVLLPALALLPWVALTGMLAFGMRLEVNWFGATLTAFLAAVVGGVWICRAGLAAAPFGSAAVAASWPVIGLAAMCVLAKAVSVGTLLFIDNAVAAEGRALRVEAAQLMDGNLPAAPPTPDDDAAPLYIRGFAAIAADKKLFAEGSPAAEPATTDVTSAAVAEILARHAPTLDLLRRAADKPFCRFTRDWSRPSIAMLLPEMQELRGAARLLTLAARREAADGDHAAAIRDVIRVHRIGRHAGSEPILVCGLVGQATDTLALQALADILPRLTPADRPLLDDTALVDFVGTPVRFDKHFLGEEAFGLATMADLAEGREGLSFLTMIAAGGGPTAPDKALGSPLALLFRCFLLPADLASYRRFMRRHQQLTVSLSRGEGDRFAAFKQEAEAIDKDLADRRDGIFTSLLAPALSSVTRSQIKSQAHHGAAEVLVAATRARLETGTLPDAAADLVPNELSALPRDPFQADQPLLFKRTDDSWIVYSVGPDGEDDGGPLPVGAEAVAGNDDIGLRMAL